MNSQSEPIDTSVQSQSPIQIKSILPTDVCNGDSPKMEVRSSSVLDSNANNRRSTSLHKRSSRKNSNRSSKTSKTKLKRRQAGRRFLFVRQRREFGLEAILRLSRKKCYSLSILIAAKLGLSAYFIFLIVIDFQNSTYRVADVSKIRRTNFDVGTYPMSGILLLASSCCLDIVSVLIFACGFLCQCGYFRYYTRFVFVDFLMTLTAVCTLFISERKTILFLKEFFKLILEYEYGDREAKQSTHFIDFIQKEGMCCGFSNANDWKKSKWWNQRGVTRSFSQFPISCYKNESVTNVGEMAYFENGCESNIYQTVAYARIISQYLAIVKTVVLLICMLICAAMYQDFTSDSETMFNRSYRGSRRQNGADTMGRRPGTFRRTSNSPMTDDNSNVEMASSLLISPTYTTERHLFQIEELPSENQPSTTGNEEVEIDRDGNGNGTKYGTVRKSY